ncbi:MAG: hypothetical protein UT42_C0043G0007 [Candidatus Falkowbacteria bacterium GW2011_GWA2_39_24]|uniref:Resolvase HTH domain-containing protein n=1 Tax=Candidatus Falkowbacteria bacterium GW2011_GWA2_39_24 TaxID=1618634 RepID=A0A0G0NLG1_9BACT|nr:MAG: hypothetical protein UT42_C0043G0007 [Candidatus Falkowbacteria bacterium GW2011_GWA2_39_24]
MKQAELLKKGIALRQKGYSLREISELLHVAKSTTSLWFRQVQISRSGKTRLKNIADQARQKASQTCKRKRLQRWQKVADRTMVFEKGLVNYNIDQCKLILAMLYWGEGYKNGRSVTFMNSDPNMIKIYLFLFRKCFKINKDKLRAVIHLHEYHDQIKMIDYWSKITHIGKDKIKIYKKEHTGIRKKENYPGCISIRYNNAVIFDEVMLIINRFQKAIK